MRAAESPEHLQLNSSMKGPDVFVWLSQSLPEFRRTVEAAGTLLILKKNESDGTKEGL